MLKNKTVVTILLFALIESTALASINTSGYQFNAFLGGTKPRINPENLFFIGEIDQVVPTNNNQSRFTWGIGAAYRLLTPAASPLHDVTLGLDLFQFSGTQQGEVWQFQQPEYNNFTYRLPYNSWRLMVDSEWTFNPIHSLVFPFAEAGMGIANNRTSYYDMPIPGFDGTGEDLGRHNNSDFVFSIGGGIKVPVCDTVSLSLRYLYTHLGNGSTSIQGSLPVIHPLNTGFTTQDLLFGLTYTA